jgi:hypothetical protein
MTQSGSHTEPQGAIRALASMLADNQTVTQPTGKTVTDR